MRQLPIVTPQPRQAPPAVRAQLEMSARPVMPLARQAIGDWVRGLRTHLDERANFLADPRNYLLRRGIDVSDSAGFPAQHQLATAEVCTLLGACYVWWAALEVAVVAQWVGAVQVAVEFETAVFVTEVKIFATGVDPILGRPGAYAFASPVL